MNTWKTNLPKNINPELKNWLTDKGSMTKRLRSLCHEFHVDLIKEYYDQADQDLCDKLMINSDEKIKCREVFLCCGNKPIIYAEVFTPESTLKEIGGLDALGTKPLGEILFSNPSVKRGAFEFKKINHHGPLLLKAQTKQTLKQKTHWARRSRFTLQEKHLIVCEVFLFEHNPTTVVSKTQ